MPEVQKSHAGPDNFTTHKKKHTKLNLGNSKHKSILTYKFKAEDAQEDEFKHASERSYFLILILRSSKHVCMYVIFSPVKLPCSCLV